MQTFDLTNAKPHSMWATTTGRMRVVFNDHMIYECNDTITQFRKIFGLPEGPDFEVLFEHKEGAAMEGPMPWRVFECGSRLVAMYLEYMVVVDMTTGKKLFRGEYSTFPEGGVYSLPAVVDSQDRFVTVRPMSKIVTIYELDMRPVFHFKHPEFKEPTIAVMSQNYVYVSDTRSHCVFLFKLKTVRSKVISVKFFKKINARYPSMIAVDSASGQLAVLTTRRQPVIKNTVVVYDATHLSAKRLRPIDKVDVCDGPIICWNMVWCSAHKSEKKHGVMLMYGAGSKRVLVSL